MVLIGFSVEQIDMGAGLTAAHAACAIDDGCKVSASTSLAANEQAVRIAPAYITAADFGLSPQQNTPIGDLTNAGKSLSAFERAPGALPLLTALRVVRSVCAPMFCRTGIKMSSPSCSTGETTC